MSAPSAELARSLAIDPQRLGDQAIKDTLRHETDQAVARGVFGVPTLIVDDELFWGADAMDFAEAYLADPGIVGTEEMRRAAHLPVGASRRRD
jgi:2-hydroxychromene-2-carboxylate isomerase